MDTRPSPIGRILQVTSAVMAVGALVAWGWHLWGRYETIVRLEARGVALSPSADSWCQYAPTPAQIGRAIGNRTANLVFGGLDASVTIHRDTTPDEMYELLSATSRLRDISGLILYTERDYPLECFKPLRRFECLQRVSISGAVLPENIVAVLSDCRDLYSVSLRSHAGVISTSEFAGWKSTDLHSLELGCDRLVIQSLKEIRRFKDLSTLDLRESDADLDSNPSSDVVRDFEFLMELPHLIWLRIDTSHSPEFNEGLRRVLTEVELRGSPMLRIKPYAGASIETPRIPVINAPAAREAATP